MIYKASHYRGQSLAAGSEIFLFINFPSELPDKISCHLHRSASYVTVGGHKVTRSNITPYSCLFDPEEFHFTNGECHKFRNIVTIFAEKYFIVSGLAELRLGGQLFPTFSI